MLKLLEGSGGRVFLIFVFTLIVLVLNAEKVLDLGLDVTSIWALVTAAVGIGGPMVVRDIMGKKPTTPPQ